jgi:hypothetical protein
MTTPTAPCSAAMGIINHQFLHTREAEHCITVLLAIGVPDSLSTTVSVEMGHWVFPIICNCYFCGFCRLLVKLAVVDIDQL